MFKSLLFFTLAALLSLSACKKKEIPGPQGPPGTNGTGGNASTSASDIFVINTADWKVNGNVYEYTYASSLLTAKVVNEGSVKVFTEVKGVWWELPNADGDLLSQCGFSEGKLRITYADIHGGLPDPPTTANYRLVTLSGSARGISSESKITSSSLSENLQP
jgi:hypothetical protein